MAVNPFNLHATFVEKEGPLIKLWGQIDRKTVDYIDSYLVRLNDQFNKGTGKPQPTTITVGQLCYAQYNGIFYRAKVTNVTNISAGVVVVRFVDYGNSKVTSVDNVRVIDGTLASIAPQATEFYLYGVAPLTGTDLEDVTIDYMRQHMCYQDLQAFLVANVNDKVLIKIFQNGIDFGDMMVTQKLAVALDQHHQESLLRAVLGLTLPPVIQQHQWQQQAYIPLSQKANALPTSMYDVHGGAQVSDRMSALTYAVPQQHSTGETTVKTFTSPILEPNSEHNVFVSNVEDGPLSFAVQLQAAEQTLIAVTADIAAHRPIPLREPPVPGSVCLARFPGDNKLSRATIMEVMDITCRLYYVDFGNVTDVPYTDIFELPAKLINPKAMALRFCLAGLKNGPPPSVVAKEAFKDVVRGCLLRLRVAPSPEGPPLKQYGYLFKDGRDVRMLYEELAKERISRMSAPGALDCSLAPLVYEPAKTELVVDGAWVTISHINSPDEFWVQLESDQSSLEQVMALLDECCRQSRRIPNVSELKLNSPIFARFSEDDRWYRASIVKVEKGKSDVVVHVEFIDYGNEEGITDIGRLRLAEPAIVKALEVQAIRCRLNGAANIRYKVGKELWEKISAKFSDLTLETRGMVKLGPRGVGDPVVVLEELRDDTLSPPVVITMDALYKAVIGATDDANEKVNLTIITPNTTSDTWQEQETSKDHNANSTVRYGDFSASSRPAEQTDWNEGSRMKNWEENKTYGEERGKRVGGRNSSQEFGNRDGRSRFGQQRDEDAYGGFKGGRGGQHRATDRGTDWENKDSGGQSGVESGFGDGVSHEGRSGRHGSRNGGEWSGKGRHAGMDAGDSFVQGDAEEGTGSREFRGGRGGQHRGSEGGDWGSREQYRHSDGESFGRGGHRGGRGGYRGERDGGNWENKDSESGSSGRGGSYGGRGGRRGGGRDGGDSYDGDRGFGSGGYRGSHRGRKDGGAHWGNDSSGQKDGEDGFRVGYQPSKGGGGREGNEWENRSFGAGGRGGRGGQHGDWEKRSSKFVTSSDADGDSGSYYGKRGGRQGGRDFGDRQPREKKFGWNDEGDENKSMATEFSKDSRARSGGTDDWRNQRGNRKGVDGSYFDDALQSDMSNLSLNVVESTDEVWETSETPTETLPIAPTEKLSPFSGSIKEGSVDLCEVEQVTVVFVESRFNFYCHLKKNDAKLEEIMACLAEKYSSIESTSSKEGVVTLPASKPLKLEDLNVGMPCAALYSEDGIWYRARVVGEPKVEGVEVYFVDYGNGGEVVDGGVRELKPELRSLPAQAIRCCLLGLAEGEELAMDGDFEAEVTTGEFPVEALFVRRKALDGSDCVEVVLRNKDTGDCINLRYGGCEGSVEDELSSEDKENINAAVEDDIPTAQIPIGKTAEVEVVFVVSRSEFYCQLKESSDKLQEVMASLTETCSKDYTEKTEIEEEESSKAPLLSLAELNVGMPCAALYSEDGIWYRARVVGEPKVEGVEVYFVDYGNGGEVVDGGVRELKPELRSLPAQAIRCCLLGLAEGEELAMDGDFEAEVTTGEFPVEALFVKRKALDGSDCVEVVLRNKDTGDCINLRYGGCEGSVEDELSSEDKENINAAVEDDIPTAQIPIGKTAEVEVVFVVSRSEFYCQLKESSDKLQEVMASLTETCSKDYTEKTEIEEEESSKAPLLSLAELNVGMPCAALYSEDGIWYRARVVGEPKVEGVEVYFVDYGNGGEVVDGGVRELKPELRSLPAQAIRCCLLGLAEGEELAMDGDFEAEVTTGEFPVEALFVKRKALDGSDCVEVVLRNKDTGDCINLRYGGCEGLEEMETAQDLSPEDASLKLVEHDDVPKAELPIGTTLDVEVVYVVSRREFYLQIKSMSEKLQEVMNSLASSCMDQEKEEGEVPLPCEKTLRMLGLRPGMPCAALYSEDNMWYRAQVLDEPKVKDSGSGFVVNVRFVDYGNEAMVEDSGIQELIPELLALPAHGIPCRLMGLDKNLTPDEEKELEFEAATVESEALLEALFVQKALGSDHYEVLLKDATTAENINLRFGAVGEVVGGRGFGMRPAMQQGCQLDATVIWFVSPFRFYVQPLEWVADLQKYMESLQKVPRNPIFPWPPAVGTPVLARFAQDGGLYRAIVEDICSNSMVRVQYVDYGNREALSPSQVWAADPSFKTLSPQAIPCTLRGVAPNNAAGWPLPGCPLGSLDKYFSIERCSCIFHAPVEKESEVDGGIEGESRIWVSLIRPDGSSVAEELISMGLACRVEVTVEEGETEGEPQRLGEAKVEPTKDSEMVVHSVGRVLTLCAREIEKPAEVVGESSDDVVSVVLDGHTLADSEEVFSKLSESVEGMSYDSCDAIGALEHEAVIEPESGETEDEGSIQKNTVTDDLRIPIESVPVTGSEEESECIILGKSNKIDVTLQGEEEDHVVQDEGAPEVSEPGGASLNMDLSVEKLGEIHKSLLMEEKVLIEDHQHGALESALNLEEKVVVEDENLEKDVEMVAGGLEQDGEKQESESLGIEELSGCVTEDVVFDGAAGEDQCLSKDIKEDVGSEPTQGKPYEDENDELIYNFSANSIPVSTSQEKDLLDEVLEFEEAEFDTTSDLAKDILRSSVDGDKDAAARVQQVVERYYQDSSKPLAIDKIQVGGDYYTLSPADDTKVVPVKVLDLSGTLGAVVEFEDGCVDEVPLDKIYECPPEMAVLPSPEASPMSSLTVVSEPVTTGNDGELNDDSMERKLEGMKSEKNEISEKDIERKEISEKETVRKEIEKDAEKNEIPEKETVRNEISEKDAEKNEISEKETVRNEISEKETARNVISEKETARNEISEKETVRNEISEKETVRNEISEKETVRNEISEKQTEKKEIEKDAEKNEISEKDTEKKEIIQTVEK